MADQQSRLHGRNKCSCNHEAHHSKGSLHRVTVPFVPLSFFVTNRSSVMFTELLMDIAHEMLVSTTNSYLFLVNGTELNGSVTYREHDYRSTFHSSSFYSGLL